MAGGAGPSNTAVLEEANEIAFPSDEVMSSITTGSNPTSQWVRTMKSLMASMAEDMIDVSSRVENLETIERGLLISCDATFALRLQQQIIDEEHEALSAASDSHDAAVVIHQKRLFRDALEDVTQEVLSKKFDRTVAADASKILEALHEEEEAMKDRRLAMSLSESEEITRFVGRESRSEGVEGRVALTSFGMVGGSPPDDGGSRRASRKICKVCSETCFPIVETECHHTWCRSCVHDLHLVAQKDEDLVPARCCNHAVPEDVAKAVLNVSQLRSYSTKVKESGAVNPLHCL